MKYQNPELPEPSDGESGAGSKLTEFAKLAAIVTVLVGVISFVFFKAGVIFAGFVPFEWEESLYSSEANFPQADFGAVEKQKEEALQKLANRLVSIMDLNEDVTITVHYRKQNLENAYATFGGHIYIFEGLLSRLKYEEEVAALLAHEISHVKERHSIEGLGGGIMLSLLFAIISNNAAEIQVIGETVLDIEGLHFSRSMEKEADQGAIKALSALYGDLGGFQSLFERLNEINPGNQTGLEFFSTHPFVDNRISRAHDFAAKKGLQVSDPSILWITDKDEDDCGDLYE